MKTLPEQLQQLARAAQALATEATALECTLAADTSEPEDDVPCDTCAAPKPESVRTRIRAKQIDPQHTNDAKPKPGWCRVHGETTIDANGMCMEPFEYGPVPHCQVWAFGPGADEALRNRRLIRQCGYLARERDEALASLASLRETGARAEETFASFVAQARADSDRLRAENERLAASLGDERAGAARMAIAHDEALFTLRAERAARIKAEGERDLFESRVDELDAQPEPLGRVPSLSDVLRLHAQPVRELWHPDYVDVLVRTAVEAVKVAKEARRVLCCRARGFGAPRDWCGCSVCTLARRIDALPAVEASDG